MPVCLKASPGKPQIVELSNSSTGSDLSLLLAGFSQGRVLGRLHALSELVATSYIVHKPAARQSRPNERPHFRRGSSQRFTLPGRPTLIVKHDRCVTMLCGGGHRSLGAAAIRRWQPGGNTPSPRRRAPLPSSCHHPSASAHCCRPAAGCAAADPELAGAASHHQHASQGRRRGEAPADGAGHCAGPPARRPGEWRRAEPRNAPHLCQPASRCAWLTAGSREDRNLQPQPSNSAPSLPQEVLEGVLAERSALLREARELREQLAASLAQQHGGQEAGEEQQAGGTPARVLRQELLLAQVGAVPAGAGWCALVRAADCWRVNPTAIPAVGPQTAVGLPPLSLPPSTPTLQAQLGELRQAQAAWEAERHAMLSELEEERARLQEGLSQALTQASCAQVGRHVLCAAGKGCRTRLEAPGVLEGLRQTP